MKRRIYTILFLTGLLVLSSCNKDFDKINTNTNKPETSLSYGLFNSANKELMDGTRGAFTSGRLALPWVQYSAQTNYTEEDRFQYREETGDDLWYYYYSVAQDYKSIIDLNTSPKTKVQMSAYGKNVNQIAAARIMLAYVFSNLADTFGDVPYYSYGGKDPDFQGLNTLKYITPVYAPQKKIYEDILKELKEAAEMIDESAPNVFTSGDALFGTPQKLKKFANSLRLRVANRVKGVIPSASTHINEAIAGGVMQSNDDTVGLTYENNDENGSPMYRAFFVSNRDDFAPSKTFVNLLIGDKGGFGQDPRTQKYFTPKGISIGKVKNNTYVESTSFSDYIGMPYGIESAMAESQYGAKPSLLSSNVLKADYTEVLMEYAEVCFLISENKGWDDAWYKKGVQASMDRWGVDTSKSSVFVASLPPANEENVITQKYIALYMQPYEAWSEYRRTGFPSTLLKIGETTDLNAPYEFENDKGVKVTVNNYKFESLVAGLTDIPGRLKYSYQYKPLNEDNYKKALKNMGLSDDVLSGKLIWAK